MLEMQREPSFDALLEMFSNELVFVKTIDVILNSTSELYMCTVHGKKTTIKRPLCEKTVENIGNCQKRLFHVSLRSLQKRSLCVFYVSARCRQFKCCFQWVSRCTHFLMRFRVPDAMFYQIQDMIVNRVSLRTFFVFLKRTFENSLPCLVLLNPYDI